MKLPDKLLKKYHELNAVQSALGLMTWDQQVFMPKGGTAARAAHTTILSRMSHEILVSEEMLRLVEDAAKEAEPGSHKEAAVRNLLRQIDLRIKLPASLVERKAKISSEAYETWREARATSNFAKLAPYLEQLFDIARETAELRGYKDHMYDPLIDSFEEGATYEQARQMFEAIKGPIKELVAVTSKDPPDDSFLFGEWDNRQLLMFAQEMAAQIGFDFNRGRLDQTTNAFCSGTSCDDIRMTTRGGSDILSILLSTLHEMGHGLYEQNSPREWDRTPLAGGISLGVHESQSRTWENIVGRSRGHWACFYPGLQRAFPSLSGISLDAFVAGMNRAEPTYIRIGSDELTYNFHILIRFELECEILTGEVSIKDLPEAWNEKYRQYLGIVPRNDAEGCLQDVHWSRGSVGYFPTYSMGNMISWQIWHRLMEDIPDPEGLMARGEYGPILGWLTEKVYSQAKRFKPRDLVQRITGKPMGSDDYILGMRHKYG